MKIALATDHAGFELMRQLEAFLTQEGHSCKDFGPKSLNPLDDYPDFIFPAAEAVASGECEAGIIMGKSGQGEAMAANRVKGVRCALFYGGSDPEAHSVEGVSNDQYQILRLTREHNNANMLSIGAQFLSLEEVQHAVTVWLRTRFSGEERHKRRIAKLDQGPNTTSTLTAKPKPAKAKKQTEPHTDQIKEGDGTAGTLKVEH